jgi:signal transduction histidine kinase
MIDRVLDVARLETGRLSLSTDPVIVSDVVRQATELVRSLVADRHATIDDRSGEHGLEVRADGQRLVTIVADIVDNAVRHGGQSAHVVIETADDGHGTGRIIVRDDGTGMDEDLLRKVRAPFQAAGDSWATLGLSLGRRLTEAMGGMLEIESRLGAGTTVTISLPVWGGEDGTPTASGTAAPAEMRR